MADIVLADAEFIIADADTVHRRATLTISDGLVAGIAPAGVAPARGAAEAIDCRGLVLMPGLINAHTHLFQVLTRGIGKHLEVREWMRAVTYPVARQLTAAEYRASVLLACADAIRNGCTAVVDHPTHYARFHADESCRAIVESGLRGAVARGGAERSLVDAGDVRPVEEDAAAIEALAAKWAGHSRLRIWVGPSGLHACRPEGLKAFKRLAERLNTRFHIHIGESQKGHREAVEEGYAGETSIAFEHGLLDRNTSIAHAIWLTEAEIDRLAACGAQVVHCPTSNQILASGIAKIPEMLARGVPVALGTDGASSNDSTDIVAEMKACALLHRAQRLDAEAVSEKDAFRAATLGGAAVLGDDRLGRLAPGYKADIVGIKLAGNPSLTPCLDPLTAVVFYASGRDVSLVMVDGSTLYRDGRFLTIDIDSVIAQVDETARRLVAPRMAS